MLYRKGYYKYRTFIKTSGLCGRSRTTSSMACSKVTLLCVGLVAFAFLVGSGESRPASGQTHHHTIPGTHHHHHTGGGGGGGGSPQINTHHHKGPITTHHHGGAGGGGGGGGGAPGGGLNLSGGGGAPGGGLNLSGGGGAPGGDGGSGGGLLNGGIPGLSGGGPGGVLDGGVPGLGGGLGGEGGLPGLGGGLGGKGGLPGVGGGLGGLLGGGGGGGGGGAGASPELGPTGDAGQKEGLSSRPDLAGPKYGIDDLQPTFCRDTPGYNDGAVKQFFRGTRDAGDAALDGAEGLLQKVGGPGVGGLLHGVENAGQEVLCHAESGFSDLSSDFGTATQYAKHGLVDIFEGIGHPSKNKGPPPLNAFGTGVAGILDQAGKVIISAGSDAISGVSEGVKSLGDQTSH